MTRKEFLGHSLALAGAAVLPTGRLWAEEKREAADYIIDKVADSARYEALNPHFRAAFDFLRRKDLSTLPNGTYPLAGDDCRAIVQDADLVPFQERQVECHCRYIDIHAPITGPEMIGACTLTCEHLKLPFDEKGDCVLFDHKGDLLLNILLPGWFAIFYPPRGGHAPSCLVPGSARKIRKAVVKIRA